MSTLCVWFAFNHWAVFFHQQFCIIFRFRCFMWELDWGHWEISWQVSKDLEKLKYSRSSWDTLMESFFWNDLKADGALMETVCQKFKFFKPLNWGFAIFKCHKIQSFYILKLFSNRSLYLTTQDDEKLSLFAPWNERENKMKYHFAWKCWFLSRLVNYFGHQWEILTNLLFEGS